MDPITYNDEEGFTIQLQSSDVIYSMTDGWKLKLDLGEAHNLYHGLREHIIYGDAQLNDVVSLDSDVEDF